MFADPKKAELRRLKRRLKAGASIVLALAAGAFLACQKEEGGPVGTNPGGPDARGGSDEPRLRDAADAAEAGQTEGARDAGAADAEAGPGDGGEDAEAGPGDAGADAGKGLRVDKKEHRKGMPVRDNLLE
jgi:hypothetical protein